MNYLKAYTTLLFDIRLFSKITSFLMIIFALVELLGFIEGFFRADLEWSWLYANDWNKIVYLGFVCLLIVIFSLRFGFLSSKKTKFIWMAQVMWLTGLLTIFGYELVTAKLMRGSFLAPRSLYCMDCMYFDTFYGVSSGLFIILLAYLFFSPLKQLFLLVFTFVPYFDEKAKKMSSAGNNSSAKNNK